MRCPYGCEGRHGRTFHNLRAGWLNRRSERRFNRKVRSFASLPVAEQFRLIHLHGLERVRWYTLIQGLHRTSPWDTLFLRGQRGDGQR